MAGGEADENRRILVRMTKTRLLAGATVLFSIAFVLIIATVNARQRPALIDALYEIPFSDRVGHVVMMGALSLLMNATIASRGGAAVRRNMVVASLVLTLIAALEEGSQHFFDRRTMSLGDLVCSVIGIWLVGFGGVRWWLRRRHA